MSEYSVEEVREQKNHIKSGNYSKSDLLHIQRMLTAYADLREQIELARNGVTDEVVEYAVDAHNHAMVNKYGRKSLCDDIYAEPFAMRSAILAVAHLLPSGERGGVEPNFKAEKPVSNAAIDALRDVVHVVTQWRESGREPAYGQWLTLQDVVRAALTTAEPVAQDEVVAWATHHDEPMLFVTRAEAMTYCDDDEQPIPLYAAQPRAVPDGWVLVPREPTPQMLSAVEGSTCSVRVAEDDYAEYPLSEDECAEIYRNMLAAVPSPGDPS